MEIDGSLNDVQTGIDGGTDVSDLSTVFDLESIHSAFIVLDACRVEQGFTMADDGPQINVLARWLHGLQFNEAGCKIKQGIPDLG